MKKTKKLLSLLFIFLLIVIIGCDRPQPTFTTDTFIFAGEIAQTIPVKDNDGSTEFIIANPDVIEIINEMIVPLQAGKTTITIKGSTEILKIIVLPQIVCPTYLGLTEEVQLKITNYDGDIHDFNFSVSDNNILEINDITLKAIAKGKTNLIVNLKDEELVTVYMQIEVGEIKPRIVLSAEEIFVDDVFSVMVENFAVTDEFYYTSSDETILEVVGTSIFALRAGLATITATAKNDSKLIGTIEINVKGQMPILRSRASDYKVGQAVIIDIVNYQDSSLFLWTISDEKVLTIDSNYQLTALTPGDVTISIVNKADKNLTASIDVVIYPLQPLLSLANTTIQLGQKMKPDILNYHDKDSFIWVIGDAGVLSLENYLLTALKLGVTTLTVTSKTDASLTASITVSVIPILPVLAATYNDMRVGDTGYVWISNITAVDASAEDFNFTVSDPLVLNLTGDKLTALKEGVAIITATLKTNSLVRAEYTINVTKTSSVKAENGETAEGPLLLFTHEEGAKIHAGELSYVYVDEAVFAGNYRWITADGTIATVNDNGRLVAVAAGKVIITAVSKANKEIKGSITLTIYGESNVDYVSRLIAIATEELGYVEGPNDDTKYGAWYNLNYEPWCAMFVSWCCNEAGISTKIVPRYCGCIAGMAWFVAEGRFGEREAYTPKPGDIAFYRDAGQTTGSTHTGIVVAVDNNRVYTIEGNSSKMVARRSYLFTNTYIVGYGIPNYPPFEN